MMHLVDILERQNMNKSWKVSIVMLVSLRDNLENDRFLQSLVEIIFLEEPNVYSNLKGRKMTSM